HHAEPTHLTRVVARESDRDTAPAHVVRGRLVLGEAALHREDHGPGQVGGLLGGGHGGQQERDEQGDAGGSAHGHHCPSAPVVTFTADTMKFRESWLRIPRTTSWLPGGAVFNFLIMSGGPLRRSVGSLGISRRRSSRPTNGSSFQLRNDVTPIQRSGV